MTDILREAETDLADIAGLPGAIRDKVKAGLAELRRLRDAVDAEIARLTGGAEKTLAALQALAPPQVATGAGSTPPEGDAPPPPTPPGEAKPTLAF